MTVNRENLKDLILDAADRLLARHDYKKMTIEDSAREVGIGKGTIYSHFSSKQEKEPDADERKRLSILIEMLQKEN